MRIFLTFVYLTISLQTINASDEEIITYIRSVIQPLTSPEDLDPLVDAAENRRFVLLGEASHGTSEYYRWRAQISRRLIEEKGFRFIAVEGDWTSAYEVNKYVKDLPGAKESARDVLASFTRWPQWMWNNEETEELVGWLREYNMNLPEHERIGFFGIDLYAMWESIREVISFMESAYPEESDRVRNAYNCTLAFDNDPQGYAVAVYQGRVDCSENVTEIVSFLRNNAGKLSSDDPRQFFNAKQNALVVQNAERHYRAMIDRGPASWNYRVRNFKYTVERLSEYYGNNAGGIVWAHNTHVGDARATPMAHQGMENIGYLLRQKYGEENVFIVGFGTHRGSVLAGREWGAPVETMDIPGAIENSFGDLFYRAGISEGLIVFDETVPESLMQPRGHRAKGVVYSPQHEQGNYVPTILPRRYDAFIFIEKTGPLSPL
jgi:erythromycin esterase